VVSVAVVCVGAHQISGAPLAGRSKAVDDLAQLGGGHRGGVLSGADPHDVEERGPRASAGFEGGDERVRPARDHLRSAPPAAVDMAEQPLRAGRGVRPQPRRHIHRQHDPPAARARQRERGQTAAEPVRLDPAVAERVVHRAVPAAILGHQGQLDQRTNRAIGAQHGVRELEQRVRPRGQRAVELRPEPGKITSLDRGVDGPARPGMSHTRHRGHRFRLRALW
jgi:hypothetical protein